MTAPKITVIGSINMDLVIETDRMPKQGETLTGSHFSMIPGGKGANQAVAAARLGADVTMIGAVGRDPFGDELLKQLEKEKINIANVKPVTDRETGIAAITLADHDNSIIVVPGANHALTPEDLLSYETVIKNSDVVVLQLEIPIETVQKAAELARIHQVKVILNPAPIQNLPEGLLEAADFLTPNEHEFEALSVSEAYQSDVLKEKLIITQGGNGTVYFEKGDKQHVPAHKVDVVDTTGAGDAFNGGLAVKLAEGATRSEAIAFANAVGALAVTKFGAQAGMPTLEDVERFIK